jgi:hypothetical protein
LTSNCDCHDFNKEENKKFDNNGKPMDNFDVKYIRGILKRKRYASIFFFTDAFEINDPQISIPYRCITHKEGMEENRS